MPCFVSCFPFLPTACPALWPAHCPALGFKTSAAGVPGKPGVPQKDSSSTGGTLVVTFSACLDDGGAAVDRYRVKMDGALLSSQVDPNVRQVSVSGLMAESTHLLEVVARNTHGLGASITNYITMGAASNPSKPTNVLVLPSSRSAEVCISYFVSALVPQSRNGKGVVHAPSPSSLCCLGSPLHVSCRCHGHRRRTWVGVPS